ncbi:unnamed protein product [Closterium sp. Naga37s-1]|nr:unnamed protein product [Closterium sp. Naga37s-1]
MAASAASRRVLQAAPAAAPAAAPSAGGAAAPAAAPSAGGAAAPPPAPAVGAPSTAPPSSGAPSSPPAYSQGMIITSNIKSADVSKSIVVLNYLGHMTCPFLSARTIFLPTNQAWSDAFEGYKKKRSSGGLYDALDAVVNGDKLKTATEIYLFPSPPPSPSTLSTRPSSLPFPHPPLAPISLPSHSRFSSLSLPCILPLTPVPPPPHSRSSSPSLPFLLPLTLLLPLTPISPPPHSHISSLSLPFLLPLTPIPPPPHSSPPPHSHISSPSLPFLLPLTPISPPSHSLFSSLSLPFLLPLTPISPPSHPHVSSLSFPFLIPPPIFHPFTLILAPHSLDARCRCHYLASPHCAALAPNHFTLPSIPAPSFSLSDARCRCHCAAATVSRLLTALLVLSAALPPNHFTPSLSHPSPYPPFPSLDARVLLSRGNGGRQEHVAHLSAARGVVPQCCQQQSASASGGARRHSAAVHSTPKIPPARYAALSPLKSPSPSPQGTTRQHRRSTQRGMLLSEALPLEVTAQSSSSAFVPPPPSKPKTRYAAPPPSNLPFQK